MEDEDMKPFESLVEVDETYVGGKPKRYPSPKGVDLSLLDSSEGYSLIEEPPASMKGTFGRGTKKIPVFGIKERESGKVYAQIMLPDELGKKLTGKQLLAIIEKKYINEFCFRQNTRKLLPFDTFDLLLKWSIL